MCGSKQAREHREFRKPFLSSPGDGRAQRAWVQDGIWNWVAAGRGLISPGAALGGGPMLNFSVALPGVGEPTQ